VKPNFAPDPGAGVGGAARGGLVYVGRLSEEKGIATLLDAWSRVRTDEPLTVIGDGPLLHAVHERAASDTRLVLTGWLDRSEVSKRLAGCRAVVIPSLCRETFSMAVVEALAAGSPVIASRTPTLGELVAEGETGFLADAGDVDALSAAMARMLAAPGQASRMGAAARAEYEARYTPDVNYRQLMSIYEAAMAERDHEAAAGRRS
jgi:glycosyltransferase involved in cell wall biosynthesis